MQLSKRMRKIGAICLGLMWIPFGAGMIAMLGVPPGDYAWVELPVVTRYSILAGGTLAVAAGTLLAGSFAASSLANRTIHSKGLYAPAKVLRARETGTTVNRAPLVRLWLEVQPPGKPAFQAEAERLVAHRAAADSAGQPGARQVRPGDAGRRAAERRRGRACF